MSFSKSSFCISAFTKIFLSISTASLRVFRSKHPFLFSGFSTIESKILMTGSMATYIFATSFVHFIIGAILLNLSFAFQSGTKNAFMHNTLIALGKEKDYTKIMGKIGAYASLVAAFLTILLPFFTKISLLLPFKINLVFDIIGLFVVLSLTSPPVKEKIAHKSLFKVIKSGAGKEFYLLAIFTGVIMGFMMGTTPFRSIYLESLGLPIILMGFVMGLSRFVWFLVGYYAHKIETRFGVKRLVYFELLFFPLVCIIVAIINNPYIAGIIFVLSVGYFWGRTEIYTHFFLKHLIKNDDYKATMLSVKGQISFLFQGVAVIGVGYVMSISYKLGYIFSGIVLFLILVVLSPFIIKAITKHEKH